MHILYTQYYNINAHMIHTILQYKCTYDSHNIAIFRDSCMFQHIILPGFKLVCGLPR